MSLPRNQHEVVTVTGLPRCGSDRLDTTGVAVWDSIITNYTQCPTAALPNGGLGDRRVVATLSTTPSRIDNLKPTLESLLVQHSLACVYLNVPMVLRRSSPPGAGNVLTKSKVGSGNESIAPQSEILVCDHKS